MRLIIITPETDIADETKVVNTLFAAGLQRLHLRKKMYSAGDYRAYINRIDDQYHSRLVLCGAFELLREVELGGAHLNSAMRESEAGRKLLYGLSPEIVSTSFHSWNEIRENEFPYGYVFISPLFDSISKQGYNAGIDLNGAIEIKKEKYAQGMYCPEIIGLGGVGAPQIETLHHYGFDGAALLGSIWQAADPVASFREIFGITSALAGH